MLSKRGFGLNVSQQFAQPSCIRLDHQLTPDGSLHERLEEHRDPTKTGALPTFRTIFAQMDSIAIQAVDVQFAVRVL